MSEESSGWRYDIALDAWVHEATGRAWDAGDILKQTARLALANGGDPHDRVYAATQMARVLEALENNVLFEGDGIAAVFIPTMASKRKAKQ